MNPEEKALLERALQLSEENNVILRKMQRTARWAIVWGFVKFLIVVIPLVIGYIYLSPYFDQVGANYREIKELLKPQNSQGNQVNSDLINAFLSQ